ncbi:MAG: DUF302 domain-containing protein [Nitrospinae bacterium]|nr:DUF302 domain-containing protein [Nitrospinota bacterium]
MKRMMTLIGVLTTCMVLMGWSGLAFAQSSDRLDRASSSSFEKTVKQLETALKGRGMMVVATLDHQNMLRMVGSNIRGSKTLEFAKPDMMKVMSTDPDVGLEMPLKIYVYERTDGKTVVSYYKPSAGFGRYGKDELKMMGQMMDKMLDEMVAEATK